MGIFATERLLSSKGNGTRGTVPTKRSSIQVVDKDRILVDAMSMPEPSVDNTININGEI